MTRRPLPFDVLARLDGGEGHAATEVADQWPAPSTAP
jgi:hypothetical protein